MLSQAELANMPTWQAQEYMQLYARSTTANNQKKEAQKVMEIIIVIFTAAFLTSLALFVVAFFAYKYLQSKISDSVYFFESSVRANIVRTEERVEDLISYANRQIIVPNDLRSIQKKIGDLEQLAAISLESSKTLLCVVEKLHRLEESVKNINKPKPKEYLRNKYARLK